MNDRITPDELAQSKRLAEAATDMDRIIVEHWARQRSLNRQLIFGIVVLALVVGMVLFL